MAVVKPNVAVAIPDLVGRSFDFWGDGGCTAIVAKVGGGAAVVSGGRFLKPFPGAGGLDWSGAPMEGVQDRNQVRGGGEAGFFAAGQTPSLVVPGASHMVKKR
jgi:hypothetical protein